MPKRINAIISVTTLSLAFATTIAAAPAQTRNAGTPFVVNDLGLGSQISTESAQYRDYRCGPSEQFDGFTWCQRSSQERGRRTSSSLLHSRDGKIAYINRQQDPVSWDSSSEVNDEIRAHARKLGSQPKINRLPRRSGSPEGVMALWGEVAIEPLDGESVKILADGRSPRKGFLVDYLGNLVKSAQDGLPVYRITGGPGLIFVASYDQRGRGTFRVTAVDTSVLSPPVAATPAPTTVAAAESTPAAEPPPQGADLQTGVTETNDGRPDAGGNQDTGSIEGVTQVQAVADATPLTADAVRNEMTRSANERAAVQAEMARLRFAVSAAYGLIGGLLLLLVVLFVRLLVMKSRNKAALKALAAATAPSSMGASMSLRAKAGDSEAPAIVSEMPVIVPKVPESANVSAAAIAVDTPSEQTQGDALSSAPLAPAPEPIEQTNALSIVPDDVPPQTPVPANDRPNDDEPINRLAELSRLRASGMLTESEFTQLKSAIIATVSRNTVQSP